MKAASGNEADTPRTTSRAIYHGAIFSNLILPINIYDNIRSIINTIQYAIVYIDSCMILNCFQH